MATAVWAVAVAVVALSASQSPSCHAVRLDALAHSLEPTASAVVSGASAAIARLRALDLGGAGVNASGERTWVEWTGAASTSPSPPLQPPVLPAGVGVAGVADAPWVMPTRNRSQDYRHVPCVCVCVCWSCVPCRVVHSLRAPHCHSG